MLNLHVFIVELLFFELQLPFKLLYLSPEALVFLFHEALLISFLHLSFVLLIFSFTLSLRFLFLIRGNTYT